MLVLVDEEEINVWEKNNPEPYNRDEYQGAFQDIHGTPEEPYVGYIRHLASYGCGFLLGVLSKP